MCGVDDGCCSDCAIPTDLQVYGFFLGNTAVRGGGRMWLGNGYKAWESGVRT